ncbi:hypothetical protein [Methylobacterium flocculans]|uniref:hypothetical protein n=1 Tax=Methylobacterium flocculans TaxID=2984843 RepID=UPI0021F29837|nr:hypothetical protein [Methylobacterium sp. FF17]
MTPNEQAAFNAGVEAMRQMAMVAAISIETRDDANDLRQRAAAAALHGLAEGAKALLPGKPSPTPALLSSIASDPAASGERPCPECAGTMEWAKDSSNGHIRAQCETPGCLKIMQ